MRKNQIYKSEKKAADFFNKTFPVGSRLQYVVNFATYPKTKATATVTVRNEAQIITIGNEIKVLFRCDTESGHFFADIYNVIYPPEISNKELISKLF